jgi:DNA-binding NtrC family response regulator
MIDLPPLRNRREDVPELVRHFLHRRSRLTGLPFRHVEPEAMRLLQKYSWPGNVRELKDLVERADVAETQPGIVRAATIAPWLNAPAPAIVKEGNGHATALGDPLDRLPLAEVEKRVILDTLAKFEGHRARTATALGIGIRTLGIKLKKWREDGELAELPYL